jgi:hypothetical protein
LGGLVLAASLWFVHAQTASLSESAQPVAAATDDLSVMLQALELTTPQPASEAPVGGNFYTIQHGKDWPPLPGDILKLPFWPIGGDFYVLDDRNVDYAELQAEAEAAASLAALASPGGGMKPMFSLISSPGNNQVYLTNFVATLTNDSITASFSIAGGTNGFAYDIYGSESLTNSPVYSQWNWLGQGYTGNSYTFTNQPLGNMFYRLALPWQTMVVAWGDNDDGQCDVPAGLTNAIDVAGGFNSSFALKADGTVVAWGDNSQGECNVPAGLTNVTAIAAGAFHVLALLQNGTVVSWGWNISGQTNVPAGLTNVTAIAAGNSCSFAVRNDGSIVAWGYNYYGQTNVPAVGPVTQVAAGTSQGMALLTNGTVAMWGASAYDWNLTNVPAGLSNVVAIAAGYYNALALQANGTVQAWGAGNGTSRLEYDNYGQSIVPAGLSNVVAVAAGTEYSMAMQSNGTVVAWGDDFYDETDVPDRLTGVKAIAAGGYHGLAVRSGSLTPLILQEPEDVYVPVGGTATFYSEGEGVAGVTYQWQFDGVNIAGATGSSLTLTNVQATDEGSYQVLISNSAGYVTSDAANLYVVTPPVITWQSLPTNQVCIYGNYVAMAATVSAPYQANGFPLSYQWQLNGTNLYSANPTNLAFTVGDSTGSGIYSLVVSNAAGSTNASWLVTVTNAINVTNDLLLVYNTNSADSSNLCAYYLAHRPMVGGANVLGVGCDVGEFTTSTNCNSQIVFPVLNWLTNNPGKLPQYVILFYDIPTRLTDLSWPAYSAYGSVGYHLHILRPDWQPFVNYINASNLVDCEAYVDKLAAFGSNYSPGLLIISASAGNYGNTNFVLDNVRHGPGFGDADYTPYAYVISNAIPAITNANHNAGISYIDGVETTNVPFLPHITNAVNVGGYICWGSHSDWGTNLDDSNYPLDGNVQWTGNSGWWIIKTLESYNGQRYGGQGSFIKWFSSNAFGGTNYSNSPVGACSNVEEPNLEGSTTISAYFSLWASGKNFGVCAWNARNTPYFQAVGDPFVAR